MTSATRLLLPDLLALSNPTLINLNSPGGVVPVTALPIYCASKAALHSHTLSLRRQLAGRLEVIEICPPSVDTQMMQGVDLPTISVDAFARKLMPRLARGRRETWIGQARLLHAMQRLAPGWTLDLVDRTTHLR